MRSYERINTATIIEYVLKDVGRKYLIGNLCAMVYMGETKFKACFKEYTGLSFHQWLIEKRMLYAIELLKETHLTLKQVTKKTGYGHERNFCTAFKKRWKESPGAWRKRNGYDDF